MARGRRPLLELYRRLQGLPDDAGRVYEEADHRELAEFLVDCAGEYEKGAPEALTLLSLVALDAGCDGLARWIQHPRGDANRYLDAGDRETIAAFRAFVGRVRTREAAALGQHGRVRIDAYLASRGYEPGEVRAFEKRAYRFLERARTNPRAPAILRTLPVFLPLGLSMALEESARAATITKVGGAAVAAAALAAMALWLARDRDRPATDNGTADAAFAVTLDAGARIVLGWRDGRWRIVRPDGTSDFEVPDALRLPSFVEGGAAGDLTGDGIPELVLYTSAPIEAMDAIETGIWIFTRHGTSWRLLDRLPTHAGTVDVAACHALRDRLAGGEPLTLALHRARQRCPTRIGDIAIRDGALHVVQLHYGREYVRATCTANGCSALAPVVDVDADITSTAWIDTGDGTALALGTGCWNRFGSRAYGVLVRLPRGETTFTWTGGRTTVVAIDRTRVAVLGGSPCEGTFQQAAVAANVDEVDATIHQRTLLVADVTPSGELRIVDRAQLQTCCAEGAAMTVLAAEGAPRWLAIVTAEHDDSDLQHVWLYDLRRPLSEGPAAATRIANRRVRLAPLDVDGDGRDELAVALDNVGTTVYRTGLQPIAW